MRKTELERVLSETGELPCVFAVSSELSVVCSPWKLVYERPSLLTRLSLDGSGFQKAVNGEEALVVESILEKMRLWNAGELDKEDLLVFHRGLKEGAGK